MEKVHRLSKSSLKRKTLDDESRVGVKSETESLHNMVTVL